MFFTTRDQNSFIPLLHFIMLDYRILVGVVARWCIYRNGNNNRSDNDDNNNHYSDKDCYYSNIELIIV